MVSYVDGPEHSPSVGGRLIGGRYLRLRKIGTGSQGDVWECEDIRTSHRVACKSFSPSTRRTKSSVAVLDIYAEMRALQTLGGHPNVVRLIDFFVDATEVHIIMELVQGGDLCTEICENGPLPEPLAATVLRQLASAVAFCHANGVVHRDIKPENVLLVRPVQEKPEDWESEGLDNCHQQQKLQPQQLLDSCPLPLSFITPEARENALLRKGGLRGEQEKSAIMEMALRNRTNIAALLSSTDLVTGQTCADISPNVVPQNLSPLPDLQSPPPHSPAATPKSSPVRPSVFSRFGRLKIQQALAHRLGHVGAGRGIVGVKLADFALSTTVDGGMSGQKHGRGAGTRMYMAPEMKQRGSGRGSGEGRGGEGGGGGRRSGVTDGCLDLGDPVWRRVSWAAKDLVRKMLQVDPNQRLSSFEVLEHPWLNQRAVRMRDIATRCPNLLSPLLPAPAVKSLRA
ncbi:unnamed protein product [Closterium sp. NIES-64]|nr:unnamed protein product [Closterium sp. NIES-64]CAI5997799.1 unnamed protein product [Closterium sp. NIES-64]